MACPTPFFSFVNRLFALRVGLSLQWSNGLAYTVCILKLDSTYLY